MVLFLRFLGGFMFFSTLLTGFSRVLVGCRGCGACMPGGTCRHASPVDFLSGTAVFVSFSSQPILPPDSAGLEPGGLLGTYSPSLVKKSFSTLGDPSLNPRPPHLRRIRLPRQHHCGNRGLNDSKLPFPRRRSRVCNSLHATTSADEQAPPAYGTARN